MNALSSVVKDRWDSPDFKPYRDAFPAEAQASPDVFEAHVKDLTARDVKIAYLKNLQGTWFRKWGLDRSGEAKVTER